VTAVSDQKSRQVLHRVRRQHPESLLAVCGCYPQTHAEDVKKLDVDLVAGTGDRAGFIDLLEQAVSKKHHIEVIDQAFKRRVFEVLPAGGMENRTRAMLKVEDGCVNFCSYCIIPYARGPVRSLPLTQAAEQAAQLKVAGYREIVVTGIEISSWGKDLKTGETLIDLLEAICAAAPGVRVRLGSLEPRTITEDFCCRAAALKDLCPQFHLSMQSGCDGTLKRMNRKYDTARYLESVSLLNRFFDRPAVTTDMIVGFPEETETEFVQSLDFIRRCGFAQMHIFPYSIRPGTPAAKMAQIPKAVKEDRAKRAATVAAEMRKEYLDGCVGSVYPVLFEQPKEGLFFGHAPNYMEVLAEGKDLHNTVKNVRIIRTDGDKLYGNIEE
jgi:threonylcarbamoyladenosine tRNA methylthiotransferase MtaB